MLKAITSLLLLIALVNSKELHIVNNLESDIKVTVLAIGDFQIPAGNNLTVTAPDTWTSALLAKTVDCIQEDCSLYHTLVSFVFRNDTNKYVISLIGGFNLPITIIPEPEGSCSSTSCASRELLDKCPEEKKVIEDGKVIACKNSPEFFKEYCPTSFVDFEEDKFVTCPTEAGYTINFGFEN